jgi:acyl-CoA synthetase (AMP-forming)/AMP-acid ligase II
MSTNDLIRAVGNSSPIVALPTARDLVKSTPKGTTKVLDLTRFHAPFNPPNTTLVDVLRYWANAQPNRVAFYYTDGETDEDTSMTYAELDHAARAVAVKVLESNRPGSRGLLLYQPGIEFVVGFFGCLYAGCVSVPAYPPRRSRKGARIQGIALDCQAQFALTTSETISQITKDEGTRAETTWRCCSTHQVRQVSPKV